MAYKPKPKPYRDEPLVNRHPAGSIPLRVALAAERRRRALGRFLTTLELDEMVEADRLHRLSLGDTP